MTVRHVTSDDFQAWKATHQQTLDQMGVTITPMDGRWSIIRCKYEYQEGNEKVQRVWEAVINDSGDIYNTDPNWLIRYKQGMLVVGRPFQSAFKTLTHLTHASYIMKWIHYGCTKQEDVTPPSFLENLVDIIRTPLYGLKMEWISLKILFLSPFMSQGAIWDMREEYGMAEKELCRGNKAEALAPCMQRIANLIFLSDPAKNRDDVYGKLVYPEGTVHIPEGSEGRVPVRTPEALLKVGLINLSVRTHRMTAADAAAQPVQSLAPRSCWWGVLSAALAVTVIAIAVVALSILFPPLAIPVVTGALLTFTASFLTPAALGGALLFGAALVSSLTCLSYQFPFKNCEPKLEPQLAV